MKLDRADYSAIVSLCVDAVRDEYRMGRLQMPQYTLFIVQIVLNKLEKIGAICDLDKEAINKARKQS